jgi:alpha-methylacyl-CoA racemase
LVVGILTALLERQGSGEGQVVDAAMLDGVALLMAGTLGMIAGGEWIEQRASNMTDGGAPYYDCYATADGRFVAVAALEPRFYEELLARLGLAIEDWPQGDRDRWDALRERLASIFATRSRDEWVEVFAGAETCFAPVLLPSEAARDRHIVARDTYITQYGLLQPAPAPRFSRTPATIGGPPPAYGADGEQVLADWGLDGQRIAQLRRDGVLG